MLDYFGQRCFRSTMVRNPDNSNRPPPPGVAGESYDVIHTSLLQNFPQLVEELGGDPGKLLATAGLAGLDVSMARVEPTYRQLVNLLEIASRELDCLDFGMRLARLQAGEKQRSPIGKIMRTAATYGDALQFVTTHNYAHSLAARIWQHPVDQDFVFVGHDILIDGIGQRMQAVEQMLLLGHLGAVELTSGRVRARQVYFRHQPVSELRCYVRYFGVEPRFGQNAEGLLFHRSDLTHAITHPDRRAHEAMIRRIEQRFTRRRPPTHAEVRGAILRLLGTGLCDNQRVASDLQLNLRTLHRRLTAEGTSFQRVKDEVRRDMLLYCLQQTELKFSEISEQLGFYEQAVLTRKCRLWFKASPTQIRQGAKLEKASPAN